MNAMTSDSYLSFSISLSTATHPKHHYRKIGLKASYSLRRAKMVFYRPNFGNHGHSTSPGPLPHSLVGSNSRSHKSSPGGGLVARYFLNPFWTKTSISLGLTALSLLLLVMVLLSVPGPIKGLYWFSVKGEEGGSISAGVLGWCSMSCALLCSPFPFLPPPQPTATSLLVRPHRFHVEREDNRLSFSLVTNTSNCTYAPLSYVHTSRIDISPKVADELVIMNTYRP